MFPFKEDEINDLLWNQQNGHVILFLNLQTLTWSESNWHWQHRATMRRWMYGLKVSLSGWALRW